MVDRAQNVQVPYRAQRRHNMDPVFSNSIAVGRHHSHQARESHDLTCKCVDHHLLRRGGKLEQDNNEIENRKRKVAHNDVLE